MSDTENKKQEAIKDLEAWFAKSNCVEFYYEEPIKNVEDILGEERTRKSVWLGFDQLENWYKNSFVLKGLKEDDTADQFEAARHGYFVIELTNLLGKCFPNNPPSLDFHKAAGYLASVTIQKWKNEAVKSLTMILENLDTKLLKGGQNYKIAAWFTISLACKVFDKSLITSKYNYPADMKVYQQVLDKWNTTDYGEVDRMVSALCDYHLQEAKSGDGKNISNIQFSFMNEFVYAYEILSWLALREMRGYKNPETFDHPLMNLVINRLPKNAVVYQTTDLYERVIEKVNKDFAL